ncbi:hypothetical protein OG203_19940 [Nocardia sp. NBC_01499]|uniref:hypothetical protein n=1 Tax=Nocardia sp. NBC_01499 TaxID=2903597 RepID=UPI003863C707
MPQIGLAVEDAVELVELLQFLDDWLANIDPAVRASLTRFAGPDYSIEDLRTDLDRFGFLLGGNNGEQMFETNKP